MTTDENPNTTPIQNDDSAIKRNKPAFEYRQLFDTEGDRKDVDVLPMWRKLCFALGGAPFQITTTVLGFFLSIFLLEVAQIRPTYISIVIFTSKVFDAFTDPACGYLVNKSPKSRLGTLKPWILFSTPFTCCAYFFLFYVPDVSEEGKLAYYLIMLCLFQAGISCIHVPYTSMTMCISGKQEERDSATAYRMLSEGIGVLLAILIQGKLIERVRTAGQCSETDPISLSHSLAEQEWSYTLGCIITIGIFFVCILAVIFGVKEKIILVKDVAYSSYFQGIKSVLTYGPFVKASMIFLFYGLSMNIAQGNIALYCTHTLKLKHFSNFMLVGLVTTVASIPVWQFLLTRFGKKKIYAVGMIMFVPVCLSNIILPEKISFPYYIAVFFGGLSISVSLLLPWSVLPDVLDLYLVEHQERKDAIFYSFYVFFNKLACGLGLGISQLMLELGGYVTGACTQPESVSFTLRLLMTSPVILILIGLIFLWTYPINEKKRKEIQKEVHDFVLSVNSNVSEGYDDTPDVQETKINDAK